MSQEEFPNVVANLRKQAGMTQEELGKRLGVPQQTISAWEKGKTQPDLAQLRRLASLFSVPVDVLVRGFVKEDKEQQLPANVWPLGLTVKVPVFKTIRLGKENRPEQEIEEWVEMPAAEIQDGSYFCMRVKDDSMRASRLEKGDIVVIRKQAVVNNGDVAVVILPDEEEAVLRRVYYGDQGIILRADDPNCPPVVAEPHEVRIIGRVMERRTKM
ncbi:MAG: helix-turn-helix domain-containing protein [Firmicutes bacterium]|nr:helix-turn-helix domain-containing protein [Candidatus Fermentithermobacillaceae bacterium]